MFAPKDPALRAEIEARLKQGEKPRILADAFGVNISTIENWRKKQQKASADPRGMAPPTSKDASNQVGTKYKSSGGRRPITEQTAGLLVAGLFTLVSLFCGEDGDAILLTAIERESLASPLADSMRTLPSPVADAINNYSAPAVVLSVLLAIIKHKMRLVRERKAARKAGDPQKFVARPPAPPPPFVPPRNPGPPSVPEQANMPHVDPALAEAIAAARSNLNGLDGHDEAENLFA